ncbi:DUF5590 domain-containing protein [Brevibacillus sp. TJ4]|uniref:cell wall elongation regulator TseB-like domain-containing protein n=1 Tax=Brevibacillus sp. TJ4 TaxID=3234853 RepID=UPI0037D6FF90
MAVRIIAGILVILLLVAGGFGYHLTSAVVSKKQDFEQQVEQWVRERTTIAEIESIDEYRGKQHYAVVIGKNKVGTSVVAWLTEDEVAFDRMDLAVPRENVEAAIAQNYPDAGMVRMVPGLDGDKRFWEVTVQDKDGRFHYLHYDLFTGELLTSYVLSST